MREATYQNLIDTYKSTESPLGVLAAIYSSQMDSYSADALYSLRACACVCLLSVPLWFLVPASLDKALTKLEEAQAEDIAVERMNATMMVRLAAELKRQAREVPFEVEQFEVRSRNVQNV